MEDSKKTKAIKATVKTPAKKAVKKTAKKTIEKTSSKKIVKAEKKISTTQSASARTVIKRKNVTVAKIATVDRYVPARNLSANPAMSEEQGEQWMSPNASVENIPVHSTHASSLPRVVPSLIAHDPRGDWSEYQLAKIVPVTQKSAASPYDSTQVLAREKLARRKRKIRNVYAARGGLVLAIIAIPLLVVGYLHSATYKMRTEKNDIKSILAQVAGAVAVPAGATPQVFVVSDPEKLIKQSGIFAGLKTGDRVLYYGEIKTVVVYSMEKKKIIAVSRVPDDGSPASGAVSDFPK